MRRILLAAVAAIGVLAAAGQGAHRAAAQMPQCDPARSGAAPGQRYGTSADVDAKKRADAEKYRSTDANPATEACNQTPAAGGRGSTSGQQR